jgi:hypothetical protein
MVEATREALMGETNVPQPFSTVADSSLQHTVLDILLQTATDPSILGMASHLLYLGQRIG